MEVLALDQSSELLQQHRWKVVTGAGGIAPALWAATMLKSQGGSRSAVSAALDQHQKDPRVKSSPSLCKRMGWCFRGGKVVWRVWLLDCSSPCWCLASSVSAQQPRRGQGQPSPTAAACPACQTDRV